jgi:single-strand DNA-binding protein
MGFNYNQTTLVGRLTRDPESKQISETVTKTFFTLAVSRNYKKSDDSKDTDFIPVSLWGKSAEKAAIYLKKGTPILLTGKLQVRNFEKDNVIKYVTEVIGEHFQILEKKPKPTEIEPYQ